MEYQDIKVGETYNVRLKVEYKESDNENGDIATVPVDINGKKLTPDWAYYSPSDAPAFSPITPGNGIKNTESAPKYDPCRLFRKGDKVRLVEWRGRAPFDCENWEPEKAGQICIVAEDEGAERGHYLHVWKIEDMATEDDERPWLAFPIFSLELVTPVEELEPYRIGTGIDSQLLYFNNELFAELAKAEDAKRVCDLLNAEYRKENQQ